MEAAIEEVAKASEKHKLLIVDDEAQIRSVMHELLEEHFEVHEASSGLDALLMAQKVKPDVIILDIIMPGMTGLEVVKKLRDIPSTENIPVLMLSAASHRENRIDSFNFGADDFMSKPFDYDELLARIRSKIRRASKSLIHQDQSLAFGNLVMDESTLTMTVNGDAVVVTSVEFEILRLFIRNAGVIVTRPKIIEEIWANREGDDRVIDAHIVSIRKKLANFSGSLRTVYGRGYVLESAKS